MTATPPPLGTAWHTATFPGAFTRFWRSYTRFSGRAARAEFWWWTLWWGIATVAINIVYGISLFTMTLSAPTRRSLNNSTRHSSTSIPSPFGATSSHRYRSWARSHSGYSQHCSCQLPCPGLRSQCGGYTTQTEPDGGFCFTLSQAATSPSSSCSPFPLTTPAPASTEFARSPTRPAR